MLSNNEFIILVIGAGGTGGNVVTNLCRLVEPLKDIKVKIIVADGDLIEKKNRKRQPYAHHEEGLNKANVLVQKCSNAFDVDISAYPYYIEDISTLEELIHRKFNTPIIIGCVDNNKTRQLLHEYFEKADNLFYIDSGNEEWDGQVVCGIKIDGKTFAEPVGSIYPDILSDNSSIFKSEESCEEIRVEKPQQFVTNLQAAVIVLSFISDIVITQDLCSHHTTFNIKNKNMRTDKTFWARKKEDPNGNS